MRRVARRRPAASAATSKLEDDKLGFVASMDLNPQKSRVLLRLALLKSRTNAELQNLFATY